MLPTRWRGFRRTSGPGRSSGTAAQAGAAGLAQMGDVGAVETGCARRSARSSRTSARPSVDLPEPEPPTMPRTAPAGWSKSAPSGSRSAAPRPTAACASCRAATGAGPSTRIQVSHARPPVGGHLGPDGGDHGLGHRLSGWRRGRCISASRPAAPGIGWPGAAKKSRTVVSSTTMPGIEHRQPLADLGHHAQIMGDEQQRRAVARLHFAISFRICFCTVTSSAVVGSSATISFGSAAKAEAIRMRWRMPPDSSCG
jgi:hypothetical protein